MEFLAWHGWLIAGIVLACLELLSGDFVLLTIGLAAASAAVPAASGSSPAVTLGWFAVANLLLFPSFRPLLKRRLEAGSSQQASNVDALIGREATVHLDEEGASRTKIHGDDWRVDCDGPLETGDAIVVLAVHGNRLFVEKIIT